MYNLLIYLLLSCYVDTTVQPGFTTRVVNLAVFTTLVVPLNFFTTRLLRVYYARSKNFQGYYEVTTLVVNIFKGTRLFHSIKMPPKTSQAAAAATAKGKTKVCSSCGGDGHCRVTFSGCINHGKPKEQWKKFDGTDLPPPPPKGTDAGTKKKTEKWINSKGKELLRNAIIAGTVTRRSNPEEVHKQHPEWSKWKYDNFKTNLANLIEAVAFDYRRMSEDCLYYGHDIAIMKKRLTNDPPMQTPWHQSEARPLLEKDMDNNLHKTMAPIELWELRVAYREYSLKVFRDHIYQEEKKREKKATGSRFKKKKKRLPPPPRATTISEAVEDLIDGV